ncbi:MAG: aminopeptidase [Candidatus Bathyarchaeia archaeon]
MSKEEMRLMAESLVTRSMRIGRKPDGGHESVRITYNSTDPSCEEFAFMVEEECWKVGAHTLLVPYRSSRERTRYILTPEDSLKEMSPLAKAIAKTVDVTVFIGEQDNPRWSYDLGEKVRLTGPIRQKLREILDRRRVRWVYFGWPIPGAAEGYGCEIGEFRRIFFNSIRSSFSEEVRRLCEYYRAALEVCHVVLIEAEDSTKLSLRVEGRPILVDNGVISEDDVAKGDVGLNIPTGEVFVAPIETSADGVILFDVVAVPGFGKIKGLRLKFSGGKVVDYDAEEGRDVFKRFLDANTGEKDRIAELGIGCNPGADYTGGCIIVDEKIYRTLHIAIGSNTGSYHGKNKASSHLDMIKDMRRGRLYFDGKLVMEKGEPIRTV